MKQYINQGLQSYLGQHYMPWHMPGHKRKSPFSFKDETYNEFSSILNECFYYDVTEVPGLDDYHAPEEMIRSAEEELRTVYHTDLTKFLVNGSTSGILSALYAVSNIIEVTTANSQPAAPIFLVARNCHKSVFHAMELLRAEIIFIYPEEKQGIYAGVTKENLQDALKKIPKDKIPSIAGCIITSPTYEGIISNLSPISRLLHFYNIPLIVDEAHGAHFPFIKSNLLTDQDFYHEGDTTTLGTPSALEHGADIVIQSLHKTLPCLTQTAILHYKKQLPTDYTASIKKYLSLFQTSSPSYIFMAAMEQCVAWCEEHKKDFVSYYKEIRFFRERLKKAKLKNIRIFEPSMLFESDLFYDPSRIVLLTENGEKLKTILQEQYKIVVEMAGAGHVTLISTIMDSKEDLSLLYDYIIAADTQLSNPADASDTPLSEETETNSLEVILSLYPEVGRPASRSYYVYPPGVPILAAGEIITEEVLKELTSHVSQGRKIHIL